MKKKIMICSVIFISIITFFIISYDNEEVMKVSNIDNNLNDVAFYLQTEEGSEEYNSVDTIPSKEDGYVFKEAVCNDNSTVSFNNSSWSLKVSNMENGRVRCKLYFDIDNAYARDYILSLNTVNESTPDFSTTATTDEGIFMAEDDDGTSYYYRGAVEDNYFYFAGYYWRIVRINGDGTIRLIYQGTSADSTGDDANAFSSAWANNQNNNVYVGYMYGSTSSSTYEGTHANTNNSVMKNNLDNWYDENLLDYTEFIADSGFCGDRSLTSGTGIGTATSYYGAYGRLVSNKTPSFKCTNDNDLYTTSTSEYGNKALTNPVGLITADEVAYAGGVSSGTSGSSNTNYYLYTGSNYKIFSPYGYFNDSGTVRAVLFGVDTNGVLRRFSNTTTAHGVRPVINIKKDVELEGTGTNEDPFRIEGTEIPTSAKEVILTNVKISDDRSEAIKGPLTENTTGTLYKVADDYGDSYVYAGIVDNNWISFAGFYWRIIRINGDGSLRLIYNGTTTNQNGEETLIGMSAFNSGNTDNAYVGYMYGKSGSSTYEETHTNTIDSSIKEMLDDWYYYNILRTEYEKLISKEQGFCNDRSLNTTSETWWDNDTKKGYGIYETAYAPLGRLYINNTWQNSQNPSLKCSQANDYFTVSESSQGNHALIYPIGLITSDEVVLAGGFGGTSNPNYWLCNRQYYWTMSPYYAYDFFEWNDGNPYVDLGSAHVFLVNGNGDLSGAQGVRPWGIRPVINLKSDIKITGGTGMSDDPYRIEGA